MPQGSRMQFAQPGPTSPPQVQASKQQVRLPPAPAPAPPPQKKLTSYTDYQAAAQSYKPPAAATTSDR